MSTETQVNKTTVNFNGVDLILVKTTLTKGKGKGRTVVVPDETLSIDSLTTFVRAFPEALPRIYRDVVRAAGLEASEAAITKDGAGNEVFSAEDYYNAFKADCNVQRVVNPLKQAEEELAKFRNEHLELDMLAQQDADVAEIKRRAAEGDTEAQQTHASLIQFKRELVSRMKNIMRIRHEKAEKQAKKAKKA